MKRFFKPLMDEIHKMGLQYEGFLYGGLILVDGEPYVLEFNVRLGDPEAQVILPLLDFSLLSFKEGTWKDKKVKDKKVVCVVIASKGYPGDYEVGREIKIRESEEVIIFHAGTKWIDGRLVTAGGRVLNVVALGESFKEARDKVYRNINNISFENMYYRRDIALEVENL